MKIELSLVAKKRVGVLAQIASEVFREGFQLLDQKIATLNDPEFYDLTLVLEGPEVAAGRVASNLKALDAVLKLEDRSRAERPRAAAISVEELAPRLQAAFVQVVDAFPDVAGPVQRFAATLEGASRRHALFSLGQRVGRREYKKRFSLGSPLKLDLALRRIAVPALRPFAKVDAADSKLWVRSCPFCINLRAAEPCCDFLAGFLHGLLEANPGTPDVRVQEVQCKACGHAECTFSCVQA
jgi:predicted hydrocarbon binding protein